ncbi:glycosyltransferase family protein [Pedobacter jejuensis]|uniref:Glycosyl transferase n=1 Tax=Pedobacter jejuensis TaxID=1268550 RepID=A0A3N0BQ01_9SPHI|nr:hypothetical protein [Pedobacter jejuensis]RNL51127.1 hypothetical protein D7004_15510 [Pedobacter jejuensis]
MDKAVVTFAIGKAYQEYALTLAYSFLLFNGKNDIHFYIITDETILIPQKLSEKIHFVKLNSLLKNKEVLLNKIFVLDYIEAEKILLVDADSFVFGDLLPLFYKYRNNDILIWGEKISNKDGWRGNLQHILESNSLDFIYRINGGLYYFKKSVLSNLFFNVCKDLINDYDNLGLPTVYNDLKDDEIIFSLACSKMNIEIINYDSRIKAETMYYARRSINLFIGKCKLYYNNYERTTSNQLLQRKAFPVIVCFDRSSVGDFDYKLNSIFLRQYINRNLLIKITIILITSTLLNTYYIVKNFRKSISNIKHTYLF